MNFESFKAKAVARDKEQAAIAVNAARSVSNFDAMTANDDYFHHDDLRTPDPPTRTREELLRASNSSSLSAPLEKEDLVRSKTVFTTTTRYSYRTHQV